MELLVLFGLPGTGKTYIGKILEKYFGYHFFVGDQDMPKRLIHALEKQEKVTDDMRQEFFDTLRESARSLQKKYKKIVVAQTHIKDIYRQQFLQEFPHTKFIFVETDTAIREDRLLKRKGFQVNIEYW